MLGCRVYIKPENLQYTGSFKLRGATNRLLVLNENERKKGVDSLPGNAMVEIEMIVEIL